jgi:hypothetical protein
MSPAIGDDETRLAVATDGPADQAGDLVRGRLAGEHADRYGHPGEGVEDSGDPEAHPAEQALDRGQIRDPEVVWVSSPRGA